MITKLQMLMFVLAFSLSRVLLGEIYLYSDPDYPGGDFNFTVDSSTELAWLDVNLSKGLSFYEVQNMLKDNPFFHDGRGVFHGLRHASKAEVEHLFRSFGLPEQDGTLYQAKEPAILSMIGALGMTDYQIFEFFGDSWAHSFTAMITSTPGPDAISSSYAFKISDTSVNVGNTEITGNWWPLDQSRPTLGHALVKEFTGTLSTNTLAVPEVHCSILELLLVSLVLGRAKGQSSLWCHIF